MQNITLKYRSALLLLALLSLLAQGLVQYFIYNQKNDSSWVNLSGKQRMLSQKITKLSLLQNTQFSNNQSKKLKQSLKEWLGAHKKISTQKNNFTCANKKEKEERIILLKKIDRNFIKLYANSQKFIGKESKTSIKSILAIEPIYLKDMNKLVGNYERIAQKKLWLLSRLELSLFLITLLVLIIEALFVFKPATVFIKNQFKELSKTQKILEDSLLEKSKLNQALQLSLNKLESINYSLEEATTMVTLNQNGIINKANSNFYTFTGLAKEQVIGKRMSDLMVNPTHPEIFSHVWQYLRKGNVWSNEFKLIRKAQEPILVDITIIPVFDLHKEITGFIALMIDISQRMDELFSMQKEQSQLIIYGQEKERKRIAFELHDGLGQILTGLKFNIESIQVTDNPKLEKQLTIIKDLVVKTIQESRRISSNLMPINLEQYGLNGALKKLVETSIKIDETAVFITIHQPIPRQEEVKELNIYRIVQEVLNNALKHAQASQVDINIKIIGYKIHIYIQDNGKGLYENKISSYGLGLASIKQRIEEMQGQFFITNPEIKGTLVHCIIPISTIKNSDLL